MAFTHLHVHTEFSLLDGSGKINEMISQAKALGMDSLAITDHGAMYGVIDFYKAAKAQGIKPIIGCEIYITNGSRFDREVSKGDDKYYHLVLLAENNTGYNNLMKIVSLGFTEGFYYKPRVDYEVIEKYHEGIIASSACLAGIIPRLIIRNQYQAACEEAVRLQNIFGRGNFFLELQDHGIADQRTVNSMLMRMSEELDIPLICTNDIHYTYKTDAEAHDILLCIQTGKKLSDPDRMRYEGGQYYMKSPEEMAALFSYAPDAVRNTEEIAQRCNVEIEFGVQKLPRFYVPDGYTSYEYLEKLCEEGIRKRYPNYEDHEERLHYELDTIKNMGYVDYFLIVWDFINYAKSHDIMVGPGRGSAAGSIVSYCLEITDIDPIKYNLIFERFLNPERVSMPDIDVDFCFERRGEVIDYVTRKYGSDCVSQIITFGTLKARNAIRDVGRVLDMPYGAVDSIAKMIPTDLGITIDKALEASNDLRNAYETDEQIHYLIDMSKRLEGLPRHASMHAAGVVISREPIMEYVPLARGSDGAIVTQYIMTTLEELGLLKMDFLGLRTLTVIQNAVKMAQANTGRIIDLSKIDYNDKAVLDMIGSGRTMGVFQLESAGMTSFMRELKPHSIEDIIAGIALYRPGPMDFIPKYIAGKKHPEDVVYDCPEMEPILKNTYGCIVYQEQVMQIVRNLGGYSLGRSDLVRRAMSKKKASVMAKERQNFIYGNEEEGVPGCIKNGISEEVANRIYDEMTDFAKYAFNKSHAAAYAVVSLQTAYLKKYYPVEFMAALMTSVIDNPTKCGEYILHCRDTGIKVLSPSVNEGEGPFTTDGESIRYGMYAIKSIGRGVIDEIVAERKKRGEYKSIKDFLSRTYGKDLNKRAIENLIKAGALDGIGGTRRQLLESYAIILDSVARERKESMEGQMSLFDLLAPEEKKQYEVKLPQVGEYPKELKLSMEKDVLGVYLSGHPLEEYENTWRSGITALTTDFLPDEEMEEPKVRNDAREVIGGMIVSKTIKYTKTNKVMAFITVEDLVGTVEVLVFPKVYETYGRFLNEDAKIFVEGRVSAEDDKASKLIMEKLTLFDDLPKEVWVAFDTKADYEEKARKLEEICRKSLGNDTVIVYIRDQKVMKRLDRVRVKASEEWMNELAANFGGDNTVIRQKRIEKHKSMP